MSKSQNLANRFFAAHISTRYNLEDGSEVYVSSSGYVHLDGKFLFRIDKRSVGSLHNDAPGTRAELNKKILLRLSQV